MNEKVIKKLSKSEQILIEKGCGKKVEFQYAFFYDLGHIWDPFLELKVL